MSDLLSRMNPFRATSPTKSHFRSHSRSQSRTDHLAPRADSRSGSDRRSEDTRAALNVPDRPIPTSQTARDLRPPISPPGRLRSTSHPSLGSVGSSRRKPAPAPLDLSLSRHKGVDQHRQQQPIIRQPSPSPAMRIMPDHPDFTGTVTARSRPATSQGMYAHSRSQSHHLPALSAFGMEGPPRPSSALDSTLPSSLRGQYLLDTHKSIELDRPVYTPIDRPSFDVGRDGAHRGAYERPASAAGIGMLVSSVDTGDKVTSTVGSSDQTPRTRPATSTNETTPTRSLSKSAKSKSLSKKPSILRSLAHHPSLSALRKRKKDKELALAEDRHADTPDLVGGAEAEADEMGSGWTSRADTSTPTPGLPHGQAKSLWGSVKRKSKSKKGQDRHDGEKVKGLRGTQSVPGLRMSSESSDSNWRSSTDLRTPVPTEPVPAIPAQYAKSALPMANATLTALVASSATMFDRPASSAASMTNSKDSHGATTNGDKHLTPQKQLRLRRGRSEDLSPAGKLGGKYTSPNRHLSTPPVSRIKPISPPRHSMPPGTGSTASPSDGPFWDFRARDPLPLHLHSRRMSIGSETDAEYNEDDYGDLPSRRHEEGGPDDGSPVRKGKTATPRAISPSPTSAATAGSAYTEQGLTPCPTPTLPPPPRSKTTTPYGARRKGSSMPMTSHAGASKTPTSNRAHESPADTPNTTHIPTRTNTPANSAASRAESPFEVKISPMVAKRMSLDAFGTSSSALVGSGGQVLENAQAEGVEEDGMEELEEEYEEIALDENDSGAEDDNARSSFRDRSRSRSLSRTPHRRAQEYEDPDSVYGAGDNDGEHTDLDDESEMSFDGTAGGHPYASHGYGQSFGLNGVVGAAPNTLEGWVGTQLTTIKEFPSTATLDYIPDIPDLEISNSSRRQSLVRSSGVLQGLAEQADMSTASAGQRMVRSPRLSDGLVSEADVSTNGVPDSVSMKRSPAMPFGISDRSMSTAMEQSDADQSIAREGGSMYRTPLPTRMGDVPGDGGVGQTPWTAKSGMTAFFTPLTYPVPGHQQGDTSAMSGIETGEESPCAGREVSKSLPSKQIDIPGKSDGTTFSPASGSLSTARSFSSASRRLRIKHSSLPPIADEGVDITVQHNEQLSALELRLAEVVKERKEKEEQYETLRKRLSDVEHQRRTAEEGREEMSKMVGIKERQVSDSATSVRQMRQALSDNETAFDRLQVAHDDLADRLASAQQAIEMAQAEKIDVQSEIQVLASGTAVMANRIRELEEELGDARAQLRSVAAERLWNSGELNGLRSDLHSAKRQSELNISALSKAQAKLQEKETLVSLRESEVLTLRGELQEMKVKIIGLQRGMVEKDRTIEMCRDKVASKQYELDEVIVKLDEMVKEKEGLESEMQELREEVLGMKVRGDQGWAEQRDEMQLELDALRSDLALKEQLEQELDILDSQLSVSEAQTASLQHQLESARAELEAKSGDLSLTSGEVDQLHAELEAANERAERLEASKSRMERDHKRALGEAKWDVNEAREQLRNANDKLQEALIEREVSNAATKDSASRLAAYLDEIERLERELGTLKGGMEDKADEDKGRDHELERMREEMRALREDKELLNIALESKTMEVALLQRQMPKAAQGASARAGQTTPKKRLAASTSRLSMSGRGGDVTPKAGDSSMRLAKSAMGPPSAARSARTSLTGPGRPTASGTSSSAARMKRASITSIDESSDTSFASAHSVLGSATSSRIPSAFPLRGGLKGNRRESSVMGPPSHAPTSSSIGRSRQQSLGLGASRYSTTTPSGDITGKDASATGTGGRDRSTSAVLGDSTKQNRPASAMATTMSMTGVQVSPSKIPTFARGPLPRLSGMKDLAQVAASGRAQAQTQEPDIVAKVNGTERAVSVSSVRTTESVGWEGGRVNADGHFGL